MVVDAEQVLNICRLAKVKKIGMSTNVRFEQRHFPP